MSRFFLTTTWLIPAPLHTVWSCLIDTETWPSWWKYVAAVDEMARGEESGIDNIQRYHWRTSLPYSLILDLRVTQIQTHQLIVVDVKGDLDGNGRCRFSFIPATNHTLIEFDWDVQTCKSWMNWLTILTRPIFIWNHARVMKNGEQGLIQCVTSKLVHQTE